MLDIVTDPEDSTTPTARLTSTKRLAVFPNCTIATRSTLAYRGPPIATAWRMWGDIVNQITRQ